MYNSYQDQIRSYIHQTRPIEETFKDVTNKVASEQKDQFI